MKRRNPLLAGLLNMLIPGSSHLYVSEDWLRFILFFIGYSFMIFIALLLGNNIQNVAEYTASGIVYGHSSAGYLCVLFYTGMKEASARGGEIDSAAHYQSMRTHFSIDDKITKLAKLQKQRDEGLISAE